MSDNGHLPASSTPASDAGKVIELSEIDVYYGRVNALSKVIDNYPKSFKLAPAHLFKGLALVALGEKTEGVRELRTVVRMYPGTDEERRAKAKLQELGIAS